MYLYLKQQFSNVWSQDLCILLKVIEIPQRVFFFLLVTSINIYHLENYTGVLPVIVLMYFLKCT